MSDPITTAFHAVQRGAGSHVHGRGRLALGRLASATPTPEYAAVRDGVGMWDLSPLNKWDFRGPDAVEAAQRVHSNDILGMRGRAGPLRRVPGRGRPARRRRHGVPARRRPPVGHDERDGARRVLRRRDEGARRLGRLHRAGAAEPAGPGAAVAGAAAVDHRRRTSTRSRYFRFIPEPVTRGRRAGVALAHRVQRRARLRAVPAARARDPGLWEAVEAAGAIPYGVGIIEPLRVETGMIVTDYDYAAHERSPFDLGLDRVVALDARRRVHGQGDAARDRGRSAEPLQDAPARGRRAARVRGRRDARRRGGRRADEPGAQPEARDRSGSRSCAPTRPPTGARVEVALGDGTVRGTVDVLALYDPQKRRPRELSARRRPTDGRRTTT